jgi:transcriptional regulator with XRE-family HTH domain
MAKAETDVRYEHLRSLLIAARRRKKLTQIELGAKLGKTQIWVSRFESSSRKLDVIEFLDITRAIGVDPCRLLRELNE